MARSKKKPNPGSDFVDRKFFELLDTRMIELFHGPYPEKLRVKGDVIKQIRAAVGKKRGQAKPISQEALARDVGLHIEQSTVARYENEYKEVPTLHIAATAKYGIALDALAHLPQLQGKVKFGSGLANFLRRSLLDGSLPSDADVDLKQFVLSEWENEAFRTKAKFTLDEFDFIWKQMAADGLVDITPSGAVHRKKSFEESMQLMHGFYTCSRNLRNLVEDVLLHFGNFNDPGTRLQIARTIEKMLKSIVSPREFSQIGRVDDLVDFLGGIQAFDLALSIEPHNSTVVTNQYHLTLHKAFSRLVRLIEGLSPRILKEGGNPKDETQYVVEMLLKPLVNERRHVIETIVKANNTCNELRENAPQISTAQLLSKVLEEIGGPFYESALDYAADLQAAVGQALAHIAKYVDVENSGENSMLLAIVSLAKKFGELDELNSAPGSAQEQADHPQVPART